ncbi:MAG: glycosyltransferase family 4 protein [Cellulosilyticaceae bacterium]
MKGIYIMNQRVIYMLTTVFYPSIGGRESHIDNISKELIKLGYKVKIIYPVIGVGKNEIYDLNGIEVHQINIGDINAEKRYKGYKKKSQGLLGYISGYLRKNYYNHFYKEIYNYIKQDILKNNYKDNEVLIHQHDFISGYKLSKTLSKKYKQVFTNHTGEFLFLKKLPFNKEFIRLLTKHFDYVISPSEELNQFEGIRDKNTFSYIPNGVDIAQFAPVNKEEIDNLRKAYGIPLEKVVILCPRRWAPTKGIIYLVEAIEILVNQYGENNFVVAFVGNDYEDYPEYRNTIRDFIKQNKLENYILLMGNLPYEKMSEITKACDIVVIPSLMEAVSLSMLESMACGKIVIGSNTGGIPQVIKDGQNGILCEKANSKDLAKKLKENIININTLENIKEQAIETVKLKYTWEVIAKRVDTIYKQVWRK